MVFVEVVEECCGEVHLVGGECRRHGCLDTMSSSYMMMMSTIIRDYKCLGIIGLFFPFYCCDYNVNLSKFSINVNSFIIF